MKKFFSILIFLLALGNSALAATKHDHAPSIFHSFTLEADFGEDKNGSVKNWDLDGWIGNDFNKLALKSEGKMKKDDLVRNEFWGLYSRNISEFWDGQIGIRFDEKPKATSYLTLGFEGLAPYFFETQAHLFVSENGNLTARIRQEIDFLITQQLILQPFFEANFAAQKVAEQKIATGINDAEFGVQTRFEVTKKFAPYIDFHYQSKFGGTAKMARKYGENRDNFATVLGLRLRF